MLEAILGLLVVIGGLFFKTRMDKHTIDNQAEEIEMHVKKDKIIVGMDKAKKEAEIKKNEALKDNTGSNWRNEL